MDETQRMLAALNASFPDIAGMSPLDARAAVDARIGPVQNDTADMMSEDMVVAAEHGGIRVRCYSPLKSRPGAPLTVYAHGGGFLHGSIAGHDGFCRAWAAKTGTTVVSVDYRLAPEHLAPVPVEDIVAVARWAVAAGRAPDGVVLAGDSSGANLAAAACITLRNQGSSPVVGQVLIYPILDPAMRSDSQRSRAEGYFITARAVRFYWETYLGGPTEAAAPDWRVMPQTAGDLSSLPPSITVTAGLDPLCDEGRDYATLLRRAGNTSVHRHYADQFHGFLTIPNYAPGASAQDVLWSDFAELFIKEHTA